MFGEVKVLQYEVSVCKLFINSKAGCTIALERAEKVDHGDESVQMSLGGWHISKTALGHCQR